MDIKIKSEEGAFKLRVAGLLIVDGKLLTVDICNNRFKCLPGGHVHLGESSAEAMEREFKEEVKYECKIDKCLALIENFFKDEKGKVVHEICYYYQMEPVSKVETKDYVYIENDEGQLKDLKFAWVDLKALPNMDFRPAILGQKLANGDFEYQHIIYKEGK